MSRNQRAYGNLLELVTWFQLSMVLPERLPEALYAVILDLHAAEYHLDVLDRDIIPRAGCDIHTDDINQGEPVDSESHIGAASLAQIQRRRGKVRAVSHREQEQRGGAVHALHDLEGIELQLACASSARRTPDGCGI